MQEEVEFRTVSIAFQGTKFTAHMVKQGLIALLKYINTVENNPKVGENSLKRLAGRDGGMNTMEISGRIPSFEQYARKYQVRYHIEKNKGTDPPTWTVFFKANQADALKEAFQQYTKKDLERENRPSLLAQLQKAKEKAKTTGREVVKNKTKEAPQL